MATPPSPARSLCKTNTEVQEHALNLMSLLAPIKSVDMPAPRFSYIDPLLHDNGNMVVHVFIDIPQEQARHNADSTKCNGSQVHVLVAGGIS
jgi:hypothetical protein